MAYRQQKILHHTTFRCARFKRMDAGELASNWIPAQQLRHPSQLWAAKRPKLPPELAAPPDPSTACPPEMALLRRSAAANLLSTSGKYSAGSVLPVRDIPAWSLAVAMAGQ